MATYNADYIAQLDDTTPLPSDPKSQGDDAFREIKRVLKTTFPNFDVGDIVEATPDDLNELTGTALPRDTVVMWHGNTTTTPSGPPGWTICDGRERKQGGGFAPDLRGKFVMGAQGVNGNAPFVPYVGDTGGSNELIINDVGSGDPVEFSTDGHALTAQELPAHGHGMFTNEVPGSLNIPEGNKLVARGGPTYQVTEAVTQTSADVGKTGSIGGNTAHVHKLTINSQTAAPSGGTGCNVPAYVGLIYIIKD